MALKDFSTAEAADILVQLAPLMDNIFGDEKIMGRIGESINKEGMTRVGVTIETLHRVFACIPLLLVDHREDVFGIVAIVKKKAPEEVAAQSIVQTKNDLKEIFEDKDMLDFFNMFAF